MDVAVCICGLSRPLQQSTVVTYVCAAVVCELTRSFRGVYLTVTAFVDISAAEINGKKVKADAFLSSTDYTTHTRLLTVVT